MLKRYSLTLLAATAIGIVACQGASAADMGLPVKAPPVAPPPPLWNWTGFYFGGVFGLGVSRSQLSEANPSGLQNFLGEGFDLSGTFAGEGFGGVPAINFGTQIGVGPQGGFTAEYKWQAPNSPYVFGITGQFSFADLQGSTNTSTSFSGFFPKDTVCTKNFRSCQITGNQSTTISGKVKDIALIDALFGITSGPQDRTLWFVKGGAAWAKTSWSAADNFNGSFTEFGLAGTVHPGNSGTSIGSAFASANSNRWGWNVGTGVEFGLWGNWTAKIEYDFLDFGSYDVNLNTTTNIKSVGFGSGTDFFTTSLNRTMHVQQQIHLVQVGLNYKFDWATWGH
jgi:outer membrane immunogenic protein